MKPYPKYKDSGIEWLGEIPEHWGISRLKHIAETSPSNVDKKIYENEKPVLLCNYTDVYYNEQITSDIIFMDSATASDAQIAKFTLRKNDVIITKDSESCYDIAVPAVVSDRLSGVVCGYHLSLIRPNPDKSIGSFIFRSFMSNGIRDQFVYSANGVTRYGLSVYAIKNSLFLAPSLSEQKAIADFLDRKTAQIDRLVAIKEKQIEVLKEKRTAMINQAVTKGLNPNVKMKDSGIEWLEEIPEHWDCNRFKYMCSLKTEKATGTNDPFRVALENIRSWTGEYIATSSEFQGEGISFSKGDVLLGKLRPYLAKVLLCENDGSAVGDIYVFSPIKEYNSKFIFYRVLSEQFINIVNGSTYGAKMPRVNWDFISDLKLPIPPTSEQQAIADYLDEQTAIIDNSVEKVKNQIELLKEYRTTLISETVTGKIDVREG